VVKLTKKKIRYFMKDEKAAAKTYRKYGLPNLARDESRHFKFFKSMKGGKKNGK
jgi:rubrerythrin